MVAKTTIPNNSILGKDTNPFDYSDSYQSSFTDEKHTVDSTKIGKLFFASEPKWVKGLFSARNKAVELFGLKTSGKITDRQQQLDNFKCEPGEQLGLFKVLAKTDNEVVLGEDDKHLNFRVSLFLVTLAGQPEQKKLTITTTVKFNNTFGRLYFIPVRPFHKLIVPTILKGIIRQIEAEKQGSTKIKTSSLLYTNSPF